MLAHIHCHPGPYAAFRPQVGRPWNDHDVKRAVMLCELGGHEKSNAACEACQTIEQNQSI